MANKFGSDMLRCFGGLQSLLSPPAHVLSSSPHSQDSIEWWNLSVGWFWPNWWLFLEDKVKTRKSENCSNVFVSDRQQTSRMLIIHLLFCTKAGFLKMLILTDYFLFLNITLSYKNSHQLGQNQPTDKFHHSIESWEHGEEDRTWAGGLRRLWRPPKRRNIPLPNLLATVVLFRIYCNIILWMISVWPCKVLIK